MVFIYFFLFFFLDDSLAEGYVPSRITPPFCRTSSDGGLIRGASSDLERKIMSWLMEVSSSNREPSSRFTVE